MDEGPVWCAGVDGCHGGWLVVLAELRAGSVRAARCHLLPDFAAVLALTQDAGRVAVDMPIGLLEAGRAGGRDCDRAARRLLGRGASSVFSPPVRGALGAADYCEALARNRARAGTRGGDGPGLSRQAFHLLPKLRQVDACMTPMVQERVVEGHPELAFAELAGGNLDSKRRAEGRGARRALLIPHYGHHLPDAEVLRARWGRKALAADDILDASVLALTAHRIRVGEGHRLPKEEPPRDAKGLRMEIWY
jgi:predicted RNase H-like nuclease